MIPENLQKIMSRISALNKQFSSLVSRSNNVETTRPANTDNAATTPRNEIFRNVLNNAINNPEENSFINRGANIENHRSVIPMSNSGQSSYPYENIVNEAAAKYGISPALIRAIIKVESNFDTHAVSRAGARGLMQIMPTHFASHNITNASDPRQNILSGTRIFRDFFKLFNNDIEKALAAYNAGPNRVAREGIPASVQKNYVNKVLDYFRQYGGF